MEKVLFFLFLLSMYMVKSDESLKLIVKVDGSQKNSTLPKISQIQRYNAIEKGLNYLNLNFDDLFYDSQFTKFATLDTIFKESIFDNN